MTEIEISYGGDIRTLLSAENRNKVESVVQKQGAQFKGLCHRLVTGLPGMCRTNYRTPIAYDTSPNAGLAYLRKLPPDLLKGVASPPQNAKGATEYWVQLFTMHDLGSTIKGGKAVSSIFILQFDRRHFKETKRVVSNP